MYDVIIVGAGCVGSYLSALLSENGLKILVVEKDKNVADSVNCSGIIGLESFNGFDLPSSVIQKIMKDIVVHSPSGSIVEYIPKKPLAYIVDRASFDKHLHVRAVQKGVSYKMKTLVEEIEVKDSGVVVKLKSNGQIQELQSKVCVLATGFGSKIIQKAGFDNISNVVQGAQVEASFPGLKQTQIFLGRKVAPNFFAWIAPADEGRCKIGLIAEKNAAGYLRDFLRNDFVSSNVHSISKIKVSLLPMEAIEKSFSNRTIVIGEAAGQIKPTTFGGIYYGFLCADIAARTILNSFELNKFDESVFSQYELEWKQKISEDQKVALNFHKIFSKMNDKHIDVIVNLARNNGVAGFVEKFFDFDSHSSLISAFLNSPYKKWFKKEKVY